ncbi:MAG: hypothetical protein ABI690_09000 [Chloroflexota bacterium]
MGRVFSWKPAWVLERVASAEYKVPSQSQKLSDKAACMSDGRVQQKFAD